MITISESVLIESKSARDDQLADVSNDKAKESLNRAKALLHFARVGIDELATVKQMAEFYESPENTIKSAFKNNRDEFSADGVKTFVGKELCEARSIIDLGSSNVSQATLWTPRGALRLGMLLRDSEVAKAVRTTLLDHVEQPSQSDNQEPTHPTSTAIDFETAVNLAEKINRTSTLDKATRLHLIRKVYSDAGIELPVSTAKPVVTISCPNGESHLVRWMDDIQLVQQTGSVVTLNPDYSPDPKKRLEKKPETE